MTEPTSTKPSRDDLIAALREVGNVQAVADRFGVSRMTVYRWRRDYGIDLKRLVQPAA